MALYEFIRGDFDILPNRDFSRVNNEQREYTTGTGPARYSVTKYIQSPLGYKYLPVCVVRLGRSVRHNLAYDTTKSRKQFSELMKSNSLSLLDWLSLIAESARVLTEYDARYSNYWYALIHLDNTYDLMGTYFSTVDAIDRAASKDELMTVSELTKRAKEFIRPLLRNDLETRL